MEAGGATMHRKGAALVLAAALCWSSGGLIARFITTDVWTQTAGRGFFAAATLLVFIVVRDGRNTWTLFRNLGLPGFAVAICFASASLCFVIALRHATVATILVIQSTAPLVAGVIAWIWIREVLGWARGLAMAVALFGVWQMVSGGTSGGDTLGIALSCIIALSLGIATVMVRRYSAIRMTPAMCLAGVLLMVIGLVVREPGSVSASDVGLLLLFGAGQLAIGMIFFTIGARLIPAGEAALLGLLECVCGPLWVWIFLGEEPGNRAITGGLLTVAAVAGNTIYEMVRAARHTGQRPEQSGPGRAIGGPV
jgi:drug/metabolite transporter (DMT)-like permease